MRASFLLQSENEKESRNIRLTRRQKMNKKSWMVLRIVAGLYLVFLGVQIISQVTKEQPNNLALMICAAVLFIGVGVVYAGAAISSVWKMSRGGEKSQEDDRSGCSLML